MANVRSVHSRDARGNPRQPRGSHHPQAASESGQARISDRSDPEVLRSFPRLFGEDEQRCSTHGNVQAAWYHSSKACIQEAWVKSDCLILLV